jgi:hypothetical protein
MFTTWSFGKKIEPFVVDIVCVVVALVMVALNSLIDEPVNMFEEVMEITSSSPSTKTPKGPFPTW